MADTSLPFSKIIQFDEILRTGEESHELSPSDDQRAQLAEYLNVLEISDLKATIRLSAEKDGSVRLIGRVYAQIVQACVVTLAPVPETIDCTVDRRFIRESEDIEEDLDPFDGSDEPDLVESGFIELGAVVTEVIALEMSDYPRSPEADQAAETTVKEDDGDAGADHPFAALTALKNKNG